MLSVVGINLRAQKGHSPIEPLAAAALSSAGAFGNFHLRVADAREAPAGLRPERMRVADAREARSCSA